MSFHNKAGSISILLFAISAAAAGPALAQEASPAGAVQPDHLLSAALTFLLPLGLILIFSSSVSEQRAPLTAINLMVGWAIAALAYFAVGFAFNFGGIAQVSANPAFAALYWEWYPLDQSVEVEVARLWGVLALQGWALTGGAARPEVLRLFLSHAALVGVAAVIPASALSRQGRGAAALLVSLLMGTLVYPIVGNWLWGGGWLSHSGASLSLGHGLVDFGGAAPIFLAGGAVVLASVIIFREKPSTAAGDEAAGGPPRPSPTGVPKAGRSVSAPAGTFETRPMPSAYLPLLSILGGGLVILGWFGLATGLHTPTALNFSSAQAALGGLLSGLAGATAAAAYSWFTTETFNHLMAVRGLLAGLIVSAASAPFVPLWLLALAGLLMGLALPLLVYAFEYKTKLADRSGTVATFGVSAAVSLLLVGFFADGQAGQGWNGIGPEAYAGVAGQGVSGLVVSSGYVADWPGQIQAQLLGMGAIFGWSLLVSLLAFYLYSVAVRSWRQTASDLTPAPVEQERSAAPDDQTLAEPPEGQDSGTVSARAET